MPFQFNQKENKCTIGKNILIEGFVKGSNNTVYIGESEHESRIDLRINGNDNILKINKPFAIKGLKIRVGNHVSANKTKLIIDSGFSIEGGGEFLLYNSGNILEIGENCMFSNSVTIRCGDSPHLLFDKNTGEYLDVSEGVFIGEHVWVGERVYITKRVTIPSESVVAACSVVTKRFSKENIVLGGNPAKVIRQSMQWIRNHSHLEKNSKYHESYIRVRKTFE